MADVLESAPPGHALGLSGAAEVETEVEDNDDEEPCDTTQVPQLCEVPEEDCGAPEGAQVQDDDEDAEALAFASRPASGTSSGRPTSRPASGTSSGRRRTSSCSARSAGGAGGDYQVSEGNRDVWKVFGCDTKAGRALRGLYGSGNRVQDANSKVSYPRLESPATRWEPKKQPRKPCPQQAAVRVPRPNAFTRLDRDDPRNWPAELPCPKRKPAAEILAEMQAARPEIPDNMARGRDNASEKQRLQDHFRYCGGNMMPKGAMGHVPAGEVPKVSERAEARGQVDLNGMTAEHREIFQELVLAVQRKQARIDEIDAADQADTKPSRKKTERNKEALELKNAIGVCLKDIDRLLALTEAAQ
mmetsp:Transcript_47009/g.125584  ORF Transcript_47009/g.125584 Transcript_47009/m.125584 type:complete len:359 (-) Transcript_47009:243-1319(-)